MLSSKEAEWNARRGEILKIAAELFAARGVDAVSLRDIGKAAGLHMSTLYYYFPNKAEIYAAACYWAFEQVSSATMMALNSEGSPEERLRAFTHMVVQFLCEKAAAARLLDQHFVLDTDHLGEFDYPPITRHPTERIGELLEELGSPMLEDFKPDRAGEVIWDVVYGVARYGAAHTAVNPHNNDHRAWTELADQAWRVVKRLIA